MTIRQVHTYLLLTDTWCVWLMENFTTAGTVEKKSRFTIGQSEEYVQMTLNEIFAIVKDNLGIGSLVLGVLMSVVQVSKIPVNPWTWIGNVLNKDLHHKIKEQGDKIDKLSEKISDVENEVSEDKAMSARYRIIRFEDEVRHGTLHTKEHYDQIILDIDNYEEFCKKNPWFRNNQAHWAIATIRKKYEEHNVDNSFL